MNSELQVQLTELADKLALIYVQKNPEPMSPAALANEFAEARRQILLELRRLNS